MNSTLKHAEAIAPARTGTEEIALPENDLNCVRDVHDLHMNLIRLQRGRVNRAVAGERNRGAGLDAHASAEVRRLGALISAFYRIPKREQQSLPESSGFLQKTLIDVFEQPRKRKRERPQ